MRKIGEVVRLQVQTESIKTGVKPRQTYTPEPHLIAVPVLRIDNDGVQGIAATGAFLLDVHNRTHPRSRFSGQNGISLGFTGHYVAMRDRFGDHMTDGIAGEGILVNHDGILPLEELAGGIVIRGEDREITIDGWAALNPCAPFTRFCLQLPEDQKPDRNFTEALKFLEHGMRGFQTVYPEDAGSAEIHLGDEVYAIA